MSWLNQIKGQLTTLVDEVLADTAGPGDEGYRGETTDTRTALELLSDTQKEKEDLDKLCNAKESEIAILRKQITELQNQKINDSGGGGSTAKEATSTTTAAAGGGGGGLSGRTSKSSTDNNATLEDSWCWEPDNAKPENYLSSESSSSGNGHEMVNITLEEVPLGGKAKPARRGQRSAASENKRLQQLEEENKQLNESLEELDTQHNLAMQNVLELKQGLQEKLTSVTKDYEALKKEHAEKFINGELELGKVRKQLELLEQEQKTAVLEKQAMQKKNDDYFEELKKATDEMADLQTLLEKKNNDNMELIERVKAVGKVTDNAEDERAELLLKVEQLIKEIEELKSVKEKKTSESSTSSTGKQSDDEFIVVREGDANSSGPTTPPSKEELKDKIVQLENRVSELTLESGSLTLKLQDKEMEKSLATNVLKESLLALQNQCEEQEEKLMVAREQLEEQQEKVDDLKQKAAEAIIAQEQLKALTEEKLKIETEITKMKESLSRMLELEKRLLFSEQEKESLQLELQGLRAAQDRISELESKMQRLTFENQQFKLNVEAETELLNNSAELEDKLKSINEENNTLRAELESIAQAKFRQAIAEEKQEITDLDAEEEEPFHEEKIREILSAYVKSNVAGDDTDATTEKAYKALRERIAKILDKNSKLEKNLAQVSEDVLDLQDSKLVWDHEKKTLEADISQYILQCDELMKNNEILLNELENYKRNKLETIPENNEENVLQLETQLEECSKLNQTLEVEYAELNDKIKELDHEKQELTERLRATQASNEDMNSKERDLNLQLETLELEKCNLLFELNELKSTEDKIDTNEALKQSAEKCENLESQLTRLSKDHADLVAAMQVQKTALLEARQKREETEKSLAQQELQVQRMREEMNKIQEIREIVELKEMKLHEQNSQLQQELLDKQFVAESLKSEVKAMQERLVGVEETEKSLAEHKLQDKSLRMKMQELEKIRDITAGNEIKLLEQNSELQQELMAKNIVADSLKSEVLVLQERLEKEVLHQKIDENRLSLENLQKELLVKNTLEESLRAEIKELLNALEKSISIDELEKLREAKVTLDMEHEILKEQYESQSAELQARNSTKTTTNLPSDTDSLGRIAQLEADLLATADLQKTVESLNYEKNEMIKALQQKHSENMQYYMEIQRLQPIVQQLQQVASAEVKPCLQCPTLETTIADLCKEHEKLRDQINFLKEKSDILTTNLLTEQTNQRLVQQEKTDVEVQNAAIHKDLERLREHLLEIEDMHTQETMELHRDLEETKAKMMLLQTDVSKSSNAYTSASIRANQHAETLQAQYALVVQQRDELVAKLSLAEDRESRNQAALCNLQCALEQFQNDKENDIKAATQRIRKELQTEQVKESQLHGEIATLNQQLADANQGLRAASRLSDQLEACQQTIAALREETDSLKQQNVALNEKLNSSESSQTDKIDKNLIKSLLIGYVVSGSPNDKQQVLRMISSVLDFSQTEADKVGLNKQQSSWLGAILGGGSGASGAQGTHSKDNLVQAFVQFLEQESQPKVNQANMPNLLNMNATTAATAASRRTSVASNSGSGVVAASSSTAPAPIPIQPLLFNSNVLDEFAPTRNSSSILKDILSDS